MRIFDRYLTFSILTPTLLTLAVLLVLNCSYLFIDEQSYVGEGDYSMVSALRYVLLSIPRQVSDLIPAAALIGAMLGLGELARRSEIIALRAAGVPIWRLALTLVGIGLIVSASTAAVGEFFAPPATLIAQSERAAARTQQAGALQGSTVWLYEHNRYVKVEAATARSSSPHVTTFEVSDDKAALISLGHSADVDVRGKGSWTLRGFRSLGYSDDGVSETIEASHPLQLRSAEALLDATIDLSDRSIRDLDRLRHEIERTDEDRRRLSFALWSRVAHSASPVWCVLLALPFALGNLRSARMGVRLFIAIGVGIAFVMGQQVVASGVVLTGLSPWLLAWLPSCILALVTTVLVLRTS